MEDPSVLILCSTSSTCDKCSLIGSELTCAGLRRTSERLAGADKGIKLLTRELEHGGLQRRLNGPEAAKGGRQRSPYSPWLAQPYLKASPTSQDKS